MRLSGLGTAGVALACVPCILVLLIGAGIGTGALSVIGSALSEPGLAIVAGFLAILLFAGAAALFARRRADVACETDVAETAKDDGLGHSQRGATRGEPRT